MNTTTIQDQPAPTHNALTPVWDLVIQDMQERNQVGIQRYGTPLQPFNGRDALVDAYQEALDLAVYLRQAIAERTALDDLEQEHRMMRARNERLEAELASNERKFVELEIEITHQAKTIADLQSALVP
jgi:hypothetical protein